MARNGTPLRRPGGTDITVLALSFASLSLLGGLAFAAVPIIIHLLSRRKYRELDWAAMKWLLAAIKKNARRIQLEQLILLAVRTLLVLCVVLAMAKPFLQGAGAGLLPGKRTHRILVLDGSFSMGYRLTDRDRFERAQQVAEAILADASKGDAVSLLLMSAPPRVVVGEPSANLAAVAEEIRSMELPHGGGDLPATLAKLDELLDSSSFEQKEIYFITDLQRASWGGGEGASSAPKELAAKIAARANLVLIDLGQGAADNLAITSLQLDDPLVTAGRESRFSATFRNFGRTNRTEVAVMLNVDGELQDRRTVDLPAGEEASIVINHLFNSPGKHLVELVLEDDALPIDNRRWLALNAKENIAVLLVDGEPSGDRFGSETDYLRFALAPEVSSAEASLTLRPEVVRESEFLETDLARFDAVILANVGQLTESETRVLQGYLRSGGGVIWFLGDQVSSESYNRVLAGGDDPLLPVQFGVRVGDASAGQKFVLLDPLDYAHPVIQPFRGATQGGLLTTKVFEYVRVERREGSAAQVALAYEGGDPAIVTAPVERGRVAIVTTSADIEWTNWPIWPSYVPVMNELVRYVAADRERDRTVLVNQPLAAPVPALAVEAAVTVQPPNNQLVARRIPANDEVEYFIYEGTERSGGYRLKFGPPLATEDLFAVNIDPKESDLARLEPDELREQFPGWRFVYLTNWQAIASGESSVTENRGELHRYLLMAALGLVFFETFLAWKFGHYA